jgi:hypothetical protein
MNANYQGEVLSYRIIVLFFSIGVKRGQWQRTYSIKEINLIYIYISIEKKRTNEGEEINGNNFLFA